MLGSSIEDKGSVKKIPNTVLFTDDEEWVCYFARSLLPSYLLPFKADQSRRTSSRSESSFGLAPCVYAHALTSSVGSDDIKDACELEQWEHMCVPNHCF